MSVFVKSVIIILTFCSIFPQEKVLVDSNMSLDQALSGIDIPLNIRQKLVIIDVEYYSFDGHLHKGQLVADKAVENDIEEIFKIIRKEKFPVASVVPVSEFNWSDEKSMLANNTSGFNYRLVKGTRVLSSHSKGRAVDINPMLNPQVKKEKTIPASAKYDLKKPGTISASSVIVTEFKKRGWIWGGRWRSTKDYMHFEKKMKINYLVVIIFSISFFIFPQEVKKVTFIVNTVLPDDTSFVYITGNHSLLGNWNPGEKKLENKSNIWSTVIWIPVKSHIEYKFTLGSWNREALTAGKKIPPNFQLYVENDTIVEVNIAGWNENLTLQFAGKITGTVKYHKNFPATGLQPRDIIVWLPPNYDKVPDSAFSVLYAHDGQNLFDPATSTFGVDWQLDEIADSLINVYKIRPIIIVGIYNTPQRRGEYTDSDTSKLYMKFIVNELKPFIDKNYRTKKDRNNTATSGSSAGGLISFMLAWEYPEVFSAAACFSPAFHIDNINYIPEVKKSGKKPLILYIDNGGIGLEKLLQPGVDEMINLLQEKNYKPGIDLFYKKDPNASHTESAWSQRISLPLQIFFGN